MERVRTMTVRVWMSAIWLVVMLESPTCWEDYHDSRCRMWHRVWECRRNRRSHIQSCWGILLRGLEIVLPSFDYNQQKNGSKWMMFFLVAVIYNQSIELTWKVIVDLSPRKSMLNNAEFVWHHWSSSSSLHVSAREPRSQSISLVWTILFNISIEVSPMRTFRRRRSLFIVRYVSIDMWG